MKWELRFTSNALRGLKKIDKTIAETLVTRLRQRVETTGDETGEPLKGQYRHLTKFRFGDYRFIAYVENGTVLVVKVGHRKDVYRD